MGAPAVVEFCKPVLDGTVPKLRFGGYISNRKSPSVFPVPGMTRSVCCAKGEAVKLLK
jgi:hypothetical protein